MSVHKNPAGQPVTRRAFVQQTGILAAAVSAGFSVGRSAHAAGDDTLRIGLVGCGGRGTGAAVNALKADKNAKLTALADLFPEKVENSLAQLKKHNESQVAVDEAHRFAGFDAGQRLIGSDVDVVLLAEPPHFRPMHLKACVEAGKHVFVEKPVAVDAPGVRSVVASCAEAEKKGLNVVSGLMYRYDPAMRETIERVRNGAIGEIVTLQETFMMGAASGWRSGNPGATEMERQLRNWYFYTWLSGDHNVEQHVHSLDKASWLLGDVPPVAAWGMGGRQVRVEPKFGNIFDHHAVVYEYASGVRVYSFCRQQPGCYNSTADWVFGTKGQCNLMSHAIDSPAKWRYEGPKVNAYDLEHEALFAAIRGGKPINNGHYMAQSTMVAILGRMADYSGQRVTWEEAFNSELSLAPARYAMDAEPPLLPEADGRYPIAMPGLAKAF